MEAKENSFFSSGARNAVEGGLKLGFRVWREAGRLLIYYSILPIAGRSTLQVTPPAPAPEPAPAPASSSDTSSSA